MNYYVLLGVAQDADPDTIRSAFRGLVRRYHPDVGKGSSADRFREIVAAYETLADPTRRGHYDSTLRNRRLPVSRFVEPLTTRAAPEPMLRPGSGMASSYVVYEPLWPTRLDEIIEEVLQSGEVLFAVSRGRGRL
jgi:curved DNA-binding protein CbpA